MSTSKSWAERDEISIRDLHLPNLSASTLEAMVVGVSAGSIINYLFDEAGIHPACKVRTSSPDPFQYDNDQYEPIMDRAAEAAEELYN
jgi:hypothetical protein